MQHKQPLRSNAAPFTQHYQQALTTASEAASALQHQAITGEHLLLAVLQVDTSDAAQILVAHGVTLDKARQTVKVLSANTAPEPQVLAFGPDAQQALQAAMHEAQQRGHPAVDTLHLLCGLLHDDTMGAARVLQYLGVPVQQVRADVEQRLNHRDTENTENRNSNKA